MADEIKINSALPIALFPGNVPAEHLAALNVDGTVGKTALAVAQSAYGQMYTALGEIVDTAKVVHEAERERNKASIQMYERTKVLQAGMYLDGNNVRVHLPAATATELNSTIGDHFNRASPALDMALNEIKSARTKSEAEMAASIRDPSANNVEGLGTAREIREYVKALPPHEAAMFVREAIKGKDLQIVNAVLNTRHFLSGLPASAHAALKAEAMETLAPVAAKQVKAFAWLEQNTLAGGQAAVNLLARTTVEIQQAQVTSHAALQAMRTKAKGAA